MNMKLKVLAVTITACVSAAALPSLLVPAQAQSSAPTRIDWAKEGRSLVWEAAIPAKGTKSYVFSARKGQRLSLGFIDDTGVGSMDLGKYSVEPNTDPMKMTIEVTKDYTIALVNNSKKATSFRVSFELLEPKPVPKPVKTQSGREQVQFPRGSNSAVFKRTLDADPGFGNITFIVRAQKGQLMSFGVEGAKGIETTLSLPRAMDPEIISGTGKSNAYKVVSTGEHYITVVNHSGKIATFTLSLKVVNAPAAPQITRIRLPKGEQVADLKGTLAARGSKKYVAYVTKGNLIGIVPQDNVGSNIRVRLDGKEFDFRDSTTTEHQNQSRDHIIEIYNTANKASFFHFNVGFSEHG